MRGSNHRELRPSGIRPKAEHIQKVVLRTTLKAIGGSFATCFGVQLCRGGFHWSLYIPQRLYMQSLGYEVNSRDQCLKAIKVCLSH